MRLNECARFFCPTVRLCGHKAGEVGDIFLFRAVFTSGYGMTCCRCFLENSDLPFLSKPAC